jgi:uncharacterized protein
MKKQCFFPILTLALFAIVSCKNSTNSTVDLSAPTANILKVQPKTEFPDPAAVNIGGFLGDAVKISEQGRLLSLPGWNDEQLIKIFSPESRLKSTTNDWYGEHAGKWLYSAALAANRTSDEKLKSLLFKTADYLISTQEKDGYLGTYSSDRRITDKDFNSFNTSWDVWNLSYMVLGLLEVNRYFPNEAYLSSARKIGELFLLTFGEGKQNITNYGSHSGLSATIILDPIVELYRVTGDQRYIDLANHVINQMQDREDTHIITDMLQKKDVSIVGDGKAYQLCWNLTAIAKLYLMTGNEDYLRTVENAWDNIKEYHLTVTGGPWGGIGGHIECFNSRGFWSPYGFVETCSTMSWIQLSCEMLHITGKAKYAQEIERSAYNALVGAEYPNGIEWNYHTFTNGRTHTARFIDCCPSSGALALEELSPIIYSVRNDGISCNIYTKSEASLMLPGANNVKITQDTDYPFDSKIKIVVNPEKELSFPIYIRIPDWANSSGVSVNGQPVDTVNMLKENYLTISRAWVKGDEININFPFDLEVIQQAENSNTPRAGFDPISRIQWFSLQNGPLVYSVSGLLGGKEREDSYPIPEKKPETCFVKTAAPEGIQGQAFELRIPDHSPLLFLPYFEAAGRKTNTWRLTWIQKRVES